LIYFLRHCGDYGGCDFDNIAEFIQNDFISKEFSSDELQVYLPFASVITDIVYSYYTLDDMPFINDLGQNFYEYGMATENVSMLCYLKLGYCSTFNLTYTFGMFELLNTFWSHLIVNNEYKDPLGTLSQVFEAKTNFAYLVDFQKLTCHQPDLAKRLFILFNEEDDVGELQDVTVQENMDGDTTSLSDFFTKSKKTVENHRKRKRF